ncbi:MAG: septum formation initiator family protein [Ignavibacteriales bacterium]|nr:septum formation initiator family protein [Ignavibacteriales bacterium]
MNDLYYRKDSSHKIFPNWLRRLFRNKKLIWSVVLLFIVTGMITFSDKGLLDRYHLQKQKEEMAALIQQARVDSLHLQKQSADLDTSKFAVEKVAREKYGMIREGETVYKQKK